MDPEQVRTGEDEELAEDDVAIDPAVLLRDRATYIYPLLNRLCLQLRKKYGIKVNPKWKMNDDGDVQFEFKPKPTLQYMVDPVEIAAAAKQAWLELRAKYPRVFLGASHKRFVEQYEQLVTLDEMREMDDDDFASLFQKRTKR